MSYQPIRTIYTSLDDHDDVEVSLIFADVDFPYGDILDAEIDEIRVDGVEVLGGSTVAEEALLAALVAVTDEDLEAMYLEVVEAAQEDAWGL